MSKTVDKLEAELKELEAKMSPPKVVEDLGNPEENATPEATPIITEEEAPKPKRTDWKGKYQTEAKRLAGIKASSDREKFETRQTIARLQSQVEELNNRPVAEVDPFKDIFSQEDADVVGDEAIDIVKRASKAAAERSTSELRKELAKLKKDAEDKATRDAKSAEDNKYDSFLDRLESKKDNWEAINRDPAFINYLSEVDRDSGYTRQELFHRAEGNGDVGRIVSFMNDFESKANPGKKELEEKIGPTGIPSPSVPVAKEGVTILDGSYVDKYFDDVLRGKYRGNPALRQERQLEIDIALSEGRVDPRR
jgi:hypothetical protein